MNNLKNISKKAILNNYFYCKNFNKKIMVMVKANAYGHGLKNIVKILKNKVSFWGVANLLEALKLKFLLKRKSNILVVGKSTNFKNLIKNNIQITVDSLQDLKTIKKISSKLKTTAKVHIAINTGMNRIGVKNIKEFKQMINFITKNKTIKLKGIFTHCFDADAKFSHFYKQMKKFKKYINLLKNKNILIHIGGSFCLTKTIPNFVNMVRIGLFLYGYGLPQLKRAMIITSRVIKKIRANKGEFVGYGKTKLNKNTTIGLVPMGYADGVSLKLSNIAKVTINNQKCKIIGRVCMDMLMVDITHKNIKPFDKVIVFNDANYFSKITKTSVYETLTNFSKIRAKDNIIY